MPKIISRNKALLTALVLVGYLGSYAALWGTSEVTMFAMTVDRGCIRSTRTEPALRSDWLARGPLRGFVTTLYWPVNALRLSQAEWRRK